MTFKDTYLSTISAIKSLKVAQINPQIMVNGQRVFTEFEYIFGPCSIESETQLEEIAKTVKENGFMFLRAGAYKLRTEPNSFQGLGKKGLEILHKIGKKYGLITVSEIPSLAHLDEFVKYCDIIQVGMRNMRNFELLKALGKINKPVILKRGDSSTMLEFLQASEYILKHGNDQIILCERGIRTYETLTRNTLDLTGAFILKDLVKIPVIIDPSHSIGSTEYVEKFLPYIEKLEFSGALVECAKEPEKALSDGFQALKLTDIVKFSKNKNK